MKKLIALFLTFTIIIGSFQFGFKIENVNAVQELTNAVFASGMDLFFDTIDAGVYDDLLFDLSPYRNHGSVLGNTHLTWGRHGKALEFDGYGDRVVIGDSDSLDFGTGDFTLMVWIYPHENRSDARAILSKGAYTTKGWRLTINTNGKLFFRLQDGADHYISMVSKSYIDDKAEWSHVAIVVDRDENMTMYIDAKIETSKSIIAYNGNINNVLSVYIGSRNSSNDFFDGIIDEVKIYPFTLNEQHIKNEMLTPMNGFPSQTFTQNKIGNGEWSSGTNPPYNGFIANDLSLPYAKSDSTYTTSLIQTLRYIIGFQNYRLYCTIYQDKTLITSTVDYFGWSFTFFKEGEEQTTYKIKIFPYWIQPDNTIIKIVFTTDNPTLDRYEETICINETEEHSVPLVIDAWVGDENDKFTMRVCADAVIYDKDYYALWSFDLTDLNGNIRPISWFDGWVLFRNTLKATTESGKNGYIEISSHKFFGIEYLIKYILVLGTLLYQTTLKPVIEKTTGLPLPDAPLSLIANISVADRDFAHQLTSGLVNLGNKITNALQPVIDAIYGVVKPMVQAIMDFAYDIAQAFINGVDALLFLVFGQKNMFSNFVNAIQDFLGQIGVLAGWVGTGIINIITTFSDLVSLFGTGIVWNFFSGISLGIQNITQSLENAVTFMGDFWNGTGSFSGFAFKDFFTIMALSFGLYIIGRCLIANSLEPLWDLITKGWLILSIIKEIALFGFELLDRIVSFVMRFIPFFG